jgi:hypothetical protein
MHTEIGQIAQVLEALNKTTSGLNHITLGAMAVYDSNGETVGYIAYTENNEYALYPGDKNPEAE